MERLCEAQQESRQQTCAATGYEEIRDFPELCETMRDRYSVSTLSAKLRGCRMRSLNSSIYIARPRGSEVRVSAELSISLRRLPCSATLDSQLRGPRLRRPLRWRFSGRWQTIFEAGAGVGGDEVDRRIAEDIGGLGSGVTSRRFRARSPSGTLVGLPQSTRRPPCDRSSKEATCAGSACAQRRCSSPAV